MAITNEQIDTFLTQVEDELKKLDAINEQLKESVQAMAPKATDADIKEAKALVDVAKLDAKKAGTERANALKQQLGIEDKPKVSLSGRRGAHNLV